MLRHIDSCSLTICYPSIDREMDEALPPCEIPAHHRWLTSADRWEDLLDLHAAVAPLPAAEAAIPADRVVADIVEYGLLPAEEVARREFPDEMYSFCSTVWDEAFAGAPTDRFRLVSLDFSGPLWACAGVVFTVSKRALLVTLKLAGRNKAVASRDWRIPTGADLEIDWSTPMIQEYRPRL